MAGTAARHTLWQGRESRRAGCPAPVSGGKASTRGALGGQEPQRQSNRIPKPSPLQAGSRASHCPRPVKPPMRQQSQQTAPGTGQESESLSASGHLPGTPLSHKPLSYPGGGLSPAPARLPHPARSSWGRASSICEGSSSFPPPSHTALSRTGYYGKRNQGLSGFLVSAPGKNRHSSLSEIASL